MTLGSPPHGLSMPAAPAGAIPAVWRDAQWRDRAEEWFGGFIDLLAPFLPSASCAGCPALAPTVLQSAQQKAALLSNASCSLLLVGACNHSSLSSAHLVPARAHLVQFLLLGDFSSLANLSTAWTWNNNHILSIHRRVDGTWHVYMGWAGVYNLTDWARADRPDVDSTAYQAPLDSARAAAYMRELALFLGDELSWADKLLLAQRLFYLGRADLESIGWAYVPPTARVTWAVAVRAWTLSNETEESGFAAYRANWWPESKRQWWDASQCAA